VPALPLHALESCLSQFRQSGEDVKLKLPCGRRAVGPALASYAGLVPRVDARADRYWSGRITREGSPWLRFALVEVAMHAMRRQDAIGRWARQLAMRKGAYKARVALARRLCDEVVAKWPRCG